jgi:hypothetical protein
LKYRHSSPGLLFLEEADNAFMSTIARIAAAVLAHSRITPEMIAATIRIQITSSLNWKEAFYCADRASR